MIVVVASTVICRSAALAGEVFRARLVAGSVAIGAERDGMAEAGRAVLAISSAAIWDR